MEVFQRIPAHIGIIPDGNRRWAEKNGYQKKDGYQHGINPGVELYELMLRYGIKEATFYGFTKDNNKRKVEQRECFTKACVEAVNSVSNKDANILVLGNNQSSAFPEELSVIANKRIHYGKGLINLNFLINYDWKWDLEHLIESKRIASFEIPRIDMIIRWGGRRRLSGFLPVQSVYADFYIIDDYWPDFKKAHFLEAMQWYQTCDVTLGG